GPSRRSPSGRQFKSSPTTTTCTQSWVTHFSVRASPKKQIVSISVPRSFERSRRRGDAMSLSVSPIRQFPPLRVPPPLVTSSSFPPTAARDQADTARCCLPSHDRTQTVSWCSKRTPEYGY